jgi:hypothetical protein
VPLRLLPIAHPCSESFAAMPPDAQDPRTRFCGKCNKQVHDLSARTEAEARALFREAGGARLCVRFARDGAGAVRFRAATAAVALSLAACSAAAPNQPPVTQDEALDHDMGDGIPDKDDVCPDPPNDDPTTGCPTATPTTPP